MKSYTDIKRVASRTIAMESQAIAQLGEKIDDDFAKCIELILRSTGRVIITGIGKSANIALKIVSTLNSTGTPSIFMHAADAIHGDMGMIQANDIVICISKSGDTPEIKVLIPFIKTLKTPIIAIVGNVSSYLATNADYILNTTVEREACPNNLAPTASATAQLVMGDCLAIALLECRGFSQKDFAKYHPGGALGKRLYLKVDDIYKQNDAPVVDSNDNIKKVIIEISSKRLGATAVLNNDKLIGIITDGDIRRMLQANDTLSDIKARDIMSPSPKIISSKSLVSEALDLMKNNNITQVIVVDNDKYLGIIHLHDILKEGII